MRSLIVALIMIMGITVVPTAQAISVTEVDLEAGESYVINFNNSTQEIDFDYVDSTHQEANVAVVQKSNKDHIEEYYFTCEENYDRQGKLNRHKNAGAGTYTISCVFG